MSTLSNNRVFVSVCLCVVLLCGLSRCQEPETVPIRIPTDQYPFITNMDDVGNYILRWNFDESEIRFQIQVQTLGYVAFGISESGLMVPADVVVGYVANGNATLKDFHTVAYAPPVEDRRQDWTLDSGREENGWTVMSFRRPLDSCDTPDDRPITKDTLQLIYAYDAVDPTDLNSLFHHDKRGSKPVSLLTQSRPPIQIPTGLQTVDFRNDRYPIPADQPTSFYCMVFNMSHVTQKYHAIKISPLISEATAHNVHHMILYRCRIDDPSVSVQTGQGSSCFTDAPNHVQFCREYVAGFGHGGGDIYFPEDVGLPIGGVGEPNIYVLAIHYDNSNYETGLLDSSGVQITLTSQLRQHEGAFLTMGNIISTNWTQFIPPGESNFVQKAYCSKRCLSWGFLGTGNAMPMTVAGVQYHAHEAGKSMKLRHMTYVGRDRVRENAWIDNDKSFDAHGESFRVVKDRKQIGFFDQMLLECSYDTTSKTSPTWGGWTIDNELCRAYVLYYPRKRLEGCMSWSMHDALKGPSGSKVPGQSVFTTLRDTVWGNDRGMRQNLKASLDTSIESGQCWSSMQPVKYGIDVFRQPQVIEPYVEPLQSQCFDSRIAFDAQMFGK